MSGRNPLVAVVGLAGSGKSTIVEMIEKVGYSKIQFGQVTHDEIMRRGMPRNEESESCVRKQLRAEHGMEAYAILNRHKIEAALLRGKVVIDGLYSQAELDYLRPLFPQLELIALLAPPTVRYERLKHRQIRPLTWQEARERDKQEIEVLGKAGPILMADRYIVNDDTMTEAVIRGWLYTFLK